MHYTDDTVVMMAIIRGGFFWNGLTWTDNPQEAALFRPLADQYPKRLTDIVTGSEWMLDGMHYYNTDGNNEVATLRCVNLKFTWIPDRRYQRGWKKIQR